MHSFSLAVLLTHPTQFDAPLFREITRKTSIDLDVFYLETDSISAHVDQELGFSPGWDIPLTSGYKSVCCPTGFLKRLRFLKQRCFNGRKYDLVIVPGYARLDLGLLALRYRRQSLGMRLDTVSIYPEPAWKMHVRRMVLTKVFRRYAVLHPVGSLTERFLLELGIDANRMYRFSYSIDNQRFQEGATRARTTRRETLEALGLAADSFVVLGVLKFTPRENPLELVRGFRLFHDRVPKSALILVGAGQLEGEMHRLIAEADLTDAVRMVGYVKYSDLPRWYGISDVFVHPSTLECWGVSVNEAMACCLPVIASDRVGSAHDLIRNGVNGYRYPGGDFQALSNCLEKVVREKGPSCMGDESQRLIANWNYEATIRSLEAALARVTSKTSSSLSLRTAPVSDVERLASK